MKVSCRYGWIGVCLLALLVGCSGAPINASDVPGTYVADYGFAKETVVVKADGRFEQTVTVAASGKTAAAQGTWTYDSQTNFIVFSEEFIVVTDIQGQLASNFPNNRGRAAFHVARVLGKVEFPGADSEPSYVKQ